MVARQQGVREVVFSGGEATGHPELSRLARFVTRAGLTWGVITNGRALSRPSFRHHLLELGLSYVQLSLHGSRPEVHNGLTGVDSFDEACATLQALSEWPIDVAITTVVCRANLEDLAHTVALVERLVAASPVAGRPRRHRLALIEPKGRALQGPGAPLLPRLREASLVVARILGQISNASPLSLGFDGFPWCLAPGSLGALQNLQVSGIGWVQEMDENQLFPADDGRRAYGEGCRACLKQPSCPGLYEGYFPGAAAALRPITRDCT
jgi:hypothetical protein